ncbi:putative phospholipid-binding domain protein [Asticcacaulis biprosthecium C19]|uniref:Putative phospholipid-binding domain protein n=1 Tax=Asticcacaulis biprosthecium C19 TaxID=715226 RepID=F4QT77_9CAUL|nr:BON domain-containing protein [Asticcacaulis biprosthecium]EGF89947.1 putative phospholipid-binding domain protein [Asticcacaulis biprosthecium C19]
MAYDTDLKQNVLDELNWTPNVNGAHIGVTAHDGVVTLTGHVESYSEKHDAEHAVRRVKGAKAIANEIEIKLANSAKRDDEDIARAALNVLSWDGNVPTDAIKVAVSKGWVTLSGQVEWYFQKEAAAQDIRRLMGVIGVSNEATVKPKVNTAAIAENIAFALDRSWFDTKRIKVKADGGKVTLTGAVETWSDWQEASEVAWAAEGATSVENKIVIA